MFVPSNVCFIGIIGQAAFHPNQTHRTTISTDTIEIEEMAEGEVTVIEIGVIREEMIWPHIPTSRKESPTRSSLSKAQMARATSSGTASSGCLASARRPTSIPSRNT